GGGNLERTNRQHVFDILLSHIESDTFACVGAKTAVALASIIHFDCESVDRDLETAYKALEEFTLRRKELSANNSTFVITFSGESFDDGEMFEEFLWEILSKLNAIDTKNNYAWSDQCDRSVESPNFAYSIAEHPYFIVGLHPESSRISRQLTVPAIVFNSHEQFKALKKTGAYQKLQKEIRSRDTVIQGDINPLLSNFGDRSEAIQYAAAHSVDGKFSCPFSAKQGQLEK
ncbi:TPA: guanitoxin biosynthesis heme-dependent pre-guanitoxin N-hydroxylase GntA, partial [Vibrio parahaemolyticus]